MASYDITMKQYNGSNYDTLYPKDISQQVLLNSSSIASAIGLTMANPTLADTVNQLQTNINNKSAIGSYVGTGEYGSNHKNSLTFAFVPKLVIVMGAYDGRAYYGIFINGSAYAGGFIFAYDVLYSCTWSDKTLYWYETSGADTQLNRNGTTYYYVAIG